MPLAAMAVAPATVVHDFVVTAAFVLFAAGSLLQLPVAVSQNASPTDWTLTLNGRSDEIMADQGGPPIQASCMTPGSAVGSSSAHTFTWTTGSGTCQNASSALPRGGVAPPTTMYPQQSGYSATLLLPVTELDVARYYYVKCSATRPATTVVQCMQFRLYGRTPAGVSLNLDALADGAAVLLPCDTLVLPADVAVDVVWTRAGTQMPAQQQQTSTVLSPSNTTSTVASSLMLRNTPDAGGLYTCTIDSTAYGTLVTQSVAVFRAAVAVFVGLDETPDNSQGVGPTTRVSAICEGYGYPLPSISLIKHVFTFSGNGSSQPLDGGIRTTYVFFQPNMDDRNDVSSYGCKAVNDRRVSIAYYNPPATRASILSTSTGRVALTPSSTGSPSSARGTAAISGCTRLWQSPVSWSLALLIGCIFSSSCLS